MFKKILSLALFIGACTCVLLCVGCGNAHSGVATITYETETSEQIAPVTAKIGSKIYPPDEPEKSGYRFDGWTLDGQPFTFDVMPENDITLKAAWSKLYRLTFDANGGAVDWESAEYTEGETISLPLPTRAHYKFTGWYSGNALFTASAMPAKDVELQAGWVNAVTLYFNTGVEEISVSPILEPEGTIISAPHVSSRSGYRLAYWESNGEKYEFTVMPAKDLTLRAVWIQLTNLPSLFIDLKSAAGNEISIESVTRETYVKSIISLDNTQTEYAFESAPAQFKGRGNGSWTESGGKKGYRIKFDSKQSLFGRTASKHWVIIACTNFNDTTMSRNYLAYNMAREVFDGIEYATSAEWVDVYINGSYHGLYLLCEHVRVAGGRVDIDSEYGVNDTGYLVEYDCYYSGTEGVDYFTVPGLKYAFTVHSPDPEDYNTEGKISSAEYRAQISYIKNYVSEVYKAALAKNFTKFQELADVDSFVDMYILHEFFKNADTGYSSFYLYKKPGGKLYAGPPWDFDCTTWATRGDASPQGIYVGDSVQSTSAHTASELYIALLKTSGFSKAVKTRWNVLSPKIKDFIEQNLNDEVYEANQEAMGKNFEKWTPSGWSQGNNGGTCAEKWEFEAKALKEWLLARADWLDREWSSKI